MKKNYYVYNPLWDGDEDRVPPMDEDWFLYVDQDRPDECDDCPNCDIYPNCGKESCEWYIEINGDDED